MYRYNQEWSDIKELPQDDSVQIVSIRYTDECKYLKPPQKLLDKQPESSDIEVFNYFRAICEREEFSERALRLCTHALRLNPNQYNVWNYRRRILRNLKYDSQLELCWSEEMIRDNPKNFHAWEHRRLLVNLNSNCCDASTELNLTEQLIEIDSKSYHAWQHRQWTIQTHKFSNFGLLTSELGFTEKILTDDVRNNSAWNQRFFIVKQRGRIDFHVVKKEFVFAVEKMKLAFDNESVWNYIRGLLEMFKALKKLQVYQDLISFIEHEFYEEKNHNRHLVGFLIDAKIEMILEFCESSEIVHTQKVFELCNLMAEKIDKIRHNYWKFVYKQFYFEKIKLRQQASDTGAAGGAKTDQTWRARIGKKVEGDDTIPAESVKKTKKKSAVKKANAEKANGFGTDLLFEIMNKYSK